MKQTVLVTGGTGYVGAWVVKGLLEHGHTVRLTVRNKNQKEKYQLLSEVAEKSEGSLEIWEADLLVPASFNDPAKGCDSIAHIASPFKLNIKDPQKELVDPAVNGTVNVLEAANQSGTVKKVVLTSSVVAIYGDSCDMKDQNLSAFTEEHFNTTSSIEHQPYPYSKVEAEKTAWEIANKQSSWKLVVMNPGFVMGPTLSPNSQSESLSFMSEMLGGKFKTGSADLNMAYVDVRDVAKAEIYALEHEAEGRHILVEQVTSMLGFANIIKDEFGTRYKLPKTTNPKWLIYLMAPVVGLTRAYVKKNIGFPLQFDNTKSKEKLHLEYIPLKQTVKDMVHSMDHNE